MGKLIQTVVVLGGLPAKRAAQIFVKKRKKLREELYGRQVAGEIQDMRYMFEVLPNDRMLITEVCPGITYKDGSVVGCDTPLQLMVRPNTSEQVKGCDGCGRYFKVPKNEKLLSKIKSYRIVN